MARNVIFETASFSPDRSRHQRGRVELLAKDVAKELNTYKNFGVFRTFNDVYSDKWKEGSYELDKDNTEAVHNPGTPGTRSIFNKYSAVLAGTGNTSWANQTQSEAIKQLVEKASNWRLSNNTPLIDSPETRRALRQMSGCTVRELVKASQQGYFGVATYSYADFMYCKYLNRVSNNYLITVRRFPLPVLDSIAPIGRGSQRKTGRAGNTQVQPPIGTMVTWLGVSGNDMKQILKYNYAMAFKENQAKWEDVQQEGGQNGLLNGLEAAVNPTTRSMYNGGTSVPALDNFMGAHFANVAGGSYTLKDKHWDATKVYGPIDRVKTAYGRSEEGLQWDQKFTLVFEYELRAYNGINPRQAMLDLLASILSVTYTTGGFWAGGYKGGGIRQSSVFSNLNIFKARGGFTDFMDAFSQDLTKGQEVIKDGIDSAGGTWNFIKGVLNNLGGLLFGGMLNKLGRPAKYYANSLISDAPVGLWHITIGNPHHPIMQMGNMILLNCEVEHSGPLGLDDFPTNLKVTCEFRRGKPRDQYGIENLYMGGNDRIFHSMSGKVADMYNAAAQYKANPAGSKMPEVTHGTVDTVIKNSYTDDSGVTQASGYGQTANNDNPENKIKAQKLSLAGMDRNMLMYYFGTNEGETLITAAQEQAEGSSKPPKAPEQKTTTTDQAKNENNQGS